MIGQARPPSAVCRRQGSVGRACPGGAHAAPDQTRTSQATTPRGDEAELYRRHHSDLERAVAHAVTAPRELIENACQNAWVILLRAQPDRGSIFGWLYVVATREAFRLCKRDRRHLRLDALATPDSRDAVLADACSMEDVLQAREALRILAGLPAANAKTSRSRSPATATPRSPSSPADEPTPT